MGKKGRVRRYKKNDFKGIMVIEKIRELEKWEFWGK